MYIIENDILKVAISAMGAELSSLVNKTTGLEYLWSGDEKFWGKKSPVLFPIVGTLKDNSYFFEDNRYELGRHGFARTKIFLVKEQTPVSVNFELQDDEDSRKVFPFSFSFSVIYTIEKDKLSVTYLIKNKGNDKMYFSIGGHPAFNLPLAAEGLYEDYFLQFNKTENADRWPISKDGLIEPVPQPIFENTGQLPLTRSLFYKDAIVLKDLRSDEVELRSNKHPAGLRFSFKGFPFLGIWAAKDADFVCIEPWCGIADSVNTNQQLNEKEGIVELTSDGTFERTWSVITW